MSEISIFADESGGQGGRSKYYALMLVFHDRPDDNMGEVFLDAIDNLVMEGFFERHKSEFLPSEWFGVTTPEFCRMPDTSLGYCNKRRLKGKLGRHRVLADAVYAISSSQLWQFGAAFSRGRLDCRRKRRSVWL